VVANTGVANTVVANTVVESRCPASLVAAIRAATRRHADWQQTAELVAGQLRGQLPPASILTAGERAGSPDGYRCHVLHVEPDGAFSVTAMVWRPGQVTPVHDHVTWCVFGVIQGIEYEELYALSADGGYLEEVGRNKGQQGEVSGFAPQHRRRRGHLAARVRRRHHPARQQHPPHLRPAGRGARAGLIQPRALRHRALRRRGRAYSTPE
jgi:3-mercaptopropionate dioxygenase